jgi:hypothetical protein
MLDDATKGSSGLMERKQYSCPPLIFLGGVFTPLQTEFILSNSKGVIQNAADALQKNMIRGLSENGPPKLSVVNLPFVASYPRGFEEPRFPGTEEILFDRVPVTGEAFSLIRLIKPFSRLFGAMRGLNRASAAADSVVIIYSAHLPFLAAALVHRATRRNSTICLILPDFPEFMGEGGRLYTIARTVASRIFYVLAKRVDCFVVLTRAMADRLDLGPDRFAVVEGIAAPSALPDAPLPTTSTPSTARQSNCGFAATAMPGSAWRRSRVKIRSQETRRNGRKRAPFRTQGKKRCCAMSKDFRACIVPAIDRRHMTVLNRFDTRAWRLP